MLGYCRDCLQIWKSKTVPFQDNFKYIRDLPFTVYFDFEITTGGSILHDSKMFVISYCQNYSFHPNWKLDEIVIYRSFQQNAEEIYRVDHFSQEHVRFFGTVTFDQMKEAAANVRQKSTSLSELFSVESMMMMMMMNCFCGMVD